MDEVLIEILKEARDEILRLRRVNELLQAQCDIVQTFKAALLGPPSPTGGSPDVVYIINRKIEQADQRERQNAMRFQQKYDGKQQMGGEEKVNLG